jgi:hypothetical protein
MYRTQPWLQPGLRGGPPLLGALVLALLLGCATTPEPLYAGAESQPHSEHLFLYPLPEALEAVRGVLSEHDYDAEPFKDGTQLLTRWRLNGRSMSGYTNITYLRRYYVQGIAVGPYRSVVRIFRIDREEPYQPGQIPSELVYTAQLAPKDRSRKNVDDGRVKEAASGGWRRYVASGMESELRQELTTDTDAQERREKRSVSTAGGSGINYLGGATRSLMADSRFGEQYAMSSQDELRGANERGVRDRDVEKELVERLEQFASLEFTGGAYDVPRAPAAPGDPLVTQQWEQEDGGTPFAGPGPCGQPIVGLGPLSSPGATVLVGEQLGTREVPAAVGNMACELAQVGRSVLLGLSLPREEQAGIDAYVKSQGSNEDVAQLLAGPFWRQVPRDGRSSRALVVLLERVRRWRAAGLDIRPFAYDASDTKGNAREEAMARELMAQRKAHPQATLLVLGGNYHVRSQDGAPWSRSFMPVGYRLTQEGVSHVSLDAAFARGKRWACSVNSYHEPECRVYATSPSAESYSRPGLAPSVQLFRKPSEAGFHGLLHVGVITPSIPALLPRATLVSQAPRP